MRLASSCQIGLPILHTHSPAFTLMNESDLRQLVLDWSALFLRLSMQDLQQHARTAGISLAQMHVLLHLHSRGPREVMEVMELMQVSPGGASLMVERLAQRGLVRRQQAPNDRRVRQVHLTAQGRGLVEASLAARSRWANDLLASLDETEKFIVGQALQMLNQRAAELRPEEIKAQPALEATLTRHLQALAVEIGSRPTGSPANRRAEDYIAGALAAAGCAVERQAFTCLDWEPLGAGLLLDGEALPAHINPFSPSCQVSAPILAVGDHAGLMAALPEMEGRIAVLYGELSAEPLFPRHFPFFTVDEHVQIVEALERGRPAAVVAVSPQESNPAPIIEDGDFALPSVTVSAAAGRKLLAQPGARASLNIRSQVHKAVGANVVGRKPGVGEGRAVVCAHFDTKPGTPGALDNAAGVATMLALAEVLPGNGPALEFIAFNGEDYYAASGQVTYLKAAGESLHGIDLVLNIDGAGLAGAGNTIALFDPPAALARQIRQTLALHPHIVEIEPWPQGDHSIFWQNGVPAVAFTTAGAWDLVGALIHTENDTVERVSVAGLKEIVAIGRDIIASLGES